MTAGRKPKPALLKTLHGNPGKRRVPTEEPDGVGDLWSAPSYMDEAQRELWDYVLEFAPPGLLTGTDLGIVESYVNAWTEYRRAVAQVRSMGQVVKTKDGNAIQNPFLGIMNRQSLLMAKYGSELGFSPAARASLGSRAPEFRDIGAGGKPRSNGLAGYLEEKPDALN